MRVGVKICGIRTVVDARAAIDAGADALGFVFAESPRRIDVNQARELFSFIPPFVTTVAVFRHPPPEELEQVVSVCAPDVFQAEPTTSVRHSLPSGVRYLPVFHEGEDEFEDIRTYCSNGTAQSAVLLEASGRGGRGVSPDWDFAERIAGQRPLILAGGLRPENVGCAMRKVRPCGVDVSSGVETRPGSKDPALIREFIAEVREAEKDIQNRSSHDPWYGRTT